ncbi:fam-i protein [Plasmodium gallinaceum]|uniref:Fam-i protein n=1 Tax=Plasmodium gallinaceum TaxID=5849 RepID=A0A1J1GW31_PLAGA|nr:fam-i protein [Plasmodium gallinaceum]CRG95508.1 fam-i protein [Plasmodium gallinaceum]
MDLNPSDPININSNKRLNEGDSTAGFAHREIKNETVTIRENPLQDDLNSRDAIQNPSKDINLDSVTSKNLLHKKSLSIFQLVIIFIFFLRFKKTYSLKLKAKNEMNVRLQKILNNCDKKMKDDLENEMLEEKKKMEDGQKKLLKKKKEMEHREKGVLRHKEEWERTLKEKHVCHESMLKVLEGRKKKITEEGEKWEKRMIIEKMELEKKMLKNKEEGEERMLKVIEKFEKKMLKEKESGWLIKGFIKLFGNKKN